MHADAKRISTPLANLKMSSLKLPIALILSAIVMTSGEFETAGLEAKIKMSQMRTKIAKLQQVDIQPEAKVAHTQSKRKAGDTHYMFDCFITRESTTNDTPPVTFDGCGGTKFNIA